MEQSGIPESKSIWPYELFHSVADIENCSEFPEKEKFWSNLKNKYPFSDADYQIARTLFYENQRRNPNYSMMDWLQYYNELDVVPFAQAIKKQFQIFHQAFGVDPSLCSSLPKYAMICLYKMYSKSAPLTCKLTRIRMMLYFFFRFIRLTIHSSS